MNKLSIIVPVYNEEKTVRLVLERLKKLKLPVKKEIVAVDDCSKDKSWQEMKKVGGIVLLRHKTNKGKGSAIRTALAKLTGDLVIIQDADLELNPEEIRNLLLFRKRTGADVVYGSRMLNKQNKHGSFLGYLANVFLSGLTSVLYGSRVTDMETCYKLVPARIMREINLKANRFDIEPEVTAKILRRGYSLKEYPISFKGRSRKEGKHIGWKDGIQAVWILIKYRFVK